MKNIVPERAGRHPRALALRPHPPLPPPTAPVAPMTTNDDHDDVFALSWLRVLLPLPKHLDAGFLLVVA